MPKEAEEWKAKGKKVILVRPESIYFFHEAGLDYVSCSPYRIPVARLAAARISIQSGKT